MEIVVAGPADEALLLDLLNSTPVVDGVSHDELDDPASAQAWLNAHGIALTRGQLQELRDVRAALQAVVRGELAPQAVQPFLNGVELSPSSLTTASPDPVRARDLASRRAGDTRVGRLTDLQPRPAAPLRQLRMPAVPDRSQQAQHGTVVLDGHLRQPHEGAPALRAEQNHDRRVTSGGANIASPVPTNASSPTTMSCPYGFQRLHG